MLRVFFALIMGLRGLAQAQIQFPDVSKGKKAVARVFRGVFPVHTLLMNFLVK
jgi:hypothetical protein